MPSHSNRTAYYVLDEGIVHEPPTLAGLTGCPFAAASAPAAAPAAEPKPPGVPSFKFGRMFDKSPVDPESTEGKALRKALIALGECMNDPQTYGRKPLPGAPALSDIPAGYTYLGQFIAHEITFDSLKELPMVEPDPKDIRSPCIDLDSLYGEGPNNDASKQLYKEEDLAQLKIGSTQSFNGIVRNNDLFRVDKDKEKRVALIADPRNDDNLAVAQTQVAFIRFHNEVVKQLREDGHNAADLFDCARMQVLRHFQWIILHDFLPNIVNEKVLAAVMEPDGVKFFKADANNLSMPLEFSAAAFRLGHSMVRSEYRWNKFHAANEPGSLSPATLRQLFAQTAASGGIGKSGASKAVPSDWMIDWRRFFKFNHDQVEPAQFNMAARIDTNFDLHLPDDSPGIPDNRSLLTVRNLLRGLALSLPTGQQVAKQMIKAQVLTEDEVLKDTEILTGPAQDILNNPLFIDKTPLWYYILKEAELKGGGNRLGPVGSRIVAETLVGLIKCSPNSILKVPDWRPRFRVHPPQDDEHFYQMADLLEFAQVVNPFEVK